MTITFENDDDIIISVLEKVISYARRTQQIFVAQCVWWLASVIGLQQGLISHMDNLRVRSEIIEAGSYLDIGTSKDSALPCESDRQDIIPRECEEYLRDSRQLREVAKLKTLGIKRTSHVKSLTAPKRIKRVDRKTSRASRKDHSKTEGISDTEISRRKSAGECLRCAWPVERKGHHRVKNCVRPIKQTSGTASHPKEKKY
jgi:hypothetical protein